MDDLQTLATALRKPDPSPEAVDEGRRRLQDAMRRRPSRRRTTGWFAAGLSVAGAAASATVVLVSGTAEPTAPPGGPPSPLSAEQVLLAAATSAERTPEGTGAYWHVRIVQQKPETDAQTRLIRERWTTRTGETWQRHSVKTGGKILKSPVRSVVMLGGVPANFQEIQKLPADPGALKARIAEAARRSKLRTSAGELTEADRERLLFLDLVSLVTTVPAPPGVRGAAFRAIASYPGVKSMGKVDGGRGLRFPVSGGHEARLVVDPETGQVRSTNFYAAPGGPTVWSPRTMTISASWTDTLPG
ncbi:CU044_5270 family protein [Spirillospora sp. NPDC048819]|uniref:CU044_5270 family protein n=1 Tax=Spirillospora sp. NPDC048819 TaxID=3155268 RepID=UPI0033F9E112